MEALCGANQTLFNQTLLLNSPWPHFTKCFRDSLLVWVPCGFLWLSLPFYMVYMFKYHMGFRIRVNKLNISKTVLSVLLFVFATLDILQNVSQSLSKSEDDPPTPTVVFLSGAIAAATYLLSAFLIQIERVKGVITSGILWIFWLMCVVAGIIPGYSKLYLKEYTSDFFPFTLFYISYICLCVQFALAFFAEKLNVNGYYNLTTGPCPELQASFPSRLVFSWMNRFIFFVYRRGLQDEDLFSLHPRDQGSNVVPQFQATWDRDLVKARGRIKFEDLTPCSSYASFQRVSSKTSVFVESSPLLMPGSFSIEVVEGRKTKSIRASLFKVLVKVYGMEMLASHLLMLAFDLLQFVSPLLLGALITFTQNRKELDHLDREWQGYVLAISFFFVSILSSILLHQCYHIGMTLGMRVKAALMSSVFKKVLTMSCHGRKDYTDSCLTNLVSVDCHRMQDVIGYLWMIWSAPLEITVAMLMLWHVVGVSTLAGLGVLVLLMPVNALMATVSRGYQRIQLRLKEKRVHLINQIVQGVKIMKIHSWEDVYMQKVEQIRSEELAILKKISYLNVCSTVCWTCAPYLVPLATFTCYVLVRGDYYIDAYTAFVSLALFNIMRFPINLLPMMATLVIHGVTSIQRLGTFLSEDDLSDDNVTFNEDFNSAIQVEKATFSWDKHGTEQPTLMNITLDIPEGQLVAVVGYSGAGKSSLLSAIVGQIERTKGYVNVKPNIAYVPQQSWVQNATVQDNVLFYRSQDSHYYNKVLDACALKPDLEMLPDGDQTELGHRGIDITLDQKQRINLARAVYQDADIYLLDDCLSGVEPSVGRHVFNKVISQRGLLKNKTRVLVTNVIHFLPQVDTIVVMVDGRISEMGSYDQLLAQEGDFARFLRNTLMEEGDLPTTYINREDPEISAIRAQMLEKVEMATPDMSSGDESWKTRSGEETYLRKSLCELTISGITLDDVRERERMKKERLLEEERVEIRKVKLSVVLSYFKAIGLVATALFFGLFVAYQGVNIYSNILLSQWTSEKLLTNISIVNESSTSSTSSFYINNVYMSSLDRISDDIQYPALPISSSSVAADLVDSSSSSIHGSSLLESSSDQLQKNYHHQLSMNDSGYWFSLSSAVDNNDINNNNNNNHSDSRSGNSSKHHHPHHEASTTTTQPRDNDSMYLAVYGALGLIQVLLVLGYALISSTKMNQASGRLHKAMLTSVMKAPMAFFDITPAGRILNRFSRDIDTLDNTLPQHLRSWMNTLFSTMSILFVISYCTPTFVVIIVPLTILYYLIQRLYIPVSRELKKMESVTRTPIHTHLSETIQGASSINAYNVTTKYLEEFRHLVDRNHTCCFADVSLNRWLAIGVEGVGNLVVFFAAFLSVATDSYEASLVGLSVCLALQVTSGLSWMVRGLTDLEANVVSVERITHYSNILKEGPDSAFIKEPLQPWPQTGAIRFHHVTTREKPSFDLVLNNITCDINDGEKIGIVGTMGTDNFHLVQVLFRLVELASGSIIIDNVMISEISLRDLRNGINILSLQDPILFTGSLRQNLDPCNKFTDSQVWQAVRKAHLNDFVRETGAELMLPITEMGENLSFSNRQLICLARSLLHKTKILVFDETPIDPSHPVPAGVTNIDTEDLIQTTVRSEFKECTVLTVTNRINTVMDYDRVMVFDQGTLREMASPSYLLQDENSVFYSLARQANLV